MKCNAFMCKEELRRFPCWYIECVNAPDRHVLRASYEILEAFRAHIQDRFARCPDLQVQEFHNYLADFPHLGEAEAASCEGVVTECEVHSALKQVGLNKSPGLDGLPYEVYLTMSHMFVPILTDVFNHWFAQGAIPGSITKGVNHIAEERREACSRGLRWLQARVKESGLGPGKPFAACHQ